MPQHTGHFRVFCVRKWRSTTIYDEMRKLIKASEELKDMNIMMERCEKMMEEQEQETEQLRDERDAAVKELQELMETMNKQSPPPGVSGYFINDTA